MSEFSFIKENEITANPKIVSVIAHKRTSGNGEKDNPFRCYLVLTDFNGNVICDFDDWKELNDG